MVRDAGSRWMRCKCSSRSTSGGREKKMMKLDLSEKPPADAALVVTLRTAKSLVTVPSSLKEVSLP